MKHHVQLTSRYMVKYLTNTGGQGSRVRSVCPCHDEFWASYEDYLRRESDSDEG